MVRFSRGLNQVPWKVSSHSEITQFDGISWRCRTVTDKALCRWAFRLNMPFLPACLPSPPKAQGGQVAVPGSSWKSDSIVPSPGTGEDGWRDTKLQGVCCLIKSVHCMQSRDVTCSPYFWAWGLDISHRATDRAPRVLSGTLFIHFISLIGLQRPRDGKQLVRGHTAFIQ
jgi:hypothetical protein